jgi:uncharacterized membrane protein
MITVLFIVGLVLILAGLLLIVFAPRPKLPESSGAEARALDPAEILKQVGVILDKLDKQYRIGAFVMLVGVALVSIAAYLEAQDAKDAAEQAAALLGFT